MKGQAVYFDTIHIVETLRSGDCPTGERLFEHLQPFVRTATPQVAVRFCRVGTRDEFLDRLRSIAIDAREHLHSPILHIEAHGSPGGIQVTSGEYLPWLDFKDELTAINEASRLNLLVVLAACDGAHLVKTVQPIDRAPVWGIIGPIREVSEDEIDRAMEAFYRTLFRVGDGRAAWLAMNNALASEPTFAIYPAEFVLRYVMYHYLQTECTDEALTRRRQRLLSELARTGASAQQLEDASEWFGRSLRDHRSHFDLLKHNFFFCDLYPENSDRFQVAFDDCLRRPGTGVVLAV